MKIKWLCKNSSCQTEVETNGEIPSYCEECGGTEFELIEE